MVFHNTVTRCGYRLGKFTKSKRECYEFVGNISRNLQVFVSEVSEESNKFRCFFEYVVVDVHHNNIVVAVTTEKIHKDIQCICMTQTDDKYKGFGVAPLLYTFLAKRGIVIRCGSSQSIGAKAMWNSLCKMRGVSVIAGNHRTKEAYPCFPTEDGEVISSVDIYDGDKPYYLYLIAN